MSPLPAAKPAYLTTPGRSTRRAGISGGLEFYRGAFRGLCWDPQVFGRCLALPGVRAVRETPQALAVTIAPEALRSVAELFGVRAPARTVARLEAVAWRARSPLGRATPPAR